MRVFWRHGYEGTSVAMLTAAMGVNAPSMYASFGNKQQLFAKVVERYLKQPASYLPQALEQPTARLVAEQIFAGAIEMAMQPENPSGCLLVRGALVAGPSCETVRTRLSEIRAKAEAAVRERFERALDEGDLPASVDAADLARFVMAQVWGMSVQAAGGASREELQAVAAHALRAWPES